MNTNHVDTKQLIERHVQIQKIQKQLKEEKDHIEFTLTKVLQENNSLIIPHPTIECKLVRPSPEYNPGTLRQLFELLDADIVHSAFVPEHEELIPEHKEIIPNFTNGVKLNYLARNYGDDVKNIIEDAKAYIKPSYIKITEK